MLNLLLALVCDVAWTYGHALALNGGVEADQAFKKCVFISYVINYDYAGFKV